MVSWGRGGLPSSHNRIVCFRLELLERGELLEFFPPEVTRDLDLHSNLQLIATLHQFTHGTVTSRLVGATIGEVRRRRCLPRAPVRQKEWGQCAARGIRDMRLRAGPQNQRLGRGASGEGPYQTCH